MIFLSHFSAVMFISSSILLAFFAVILDLTQTLLRIKKVNDGLSIDSIVPFIIAREVLFAVAVSLRFMAFWAFVGESPRGEAPAVDERDQRPTNLFAIGSDASSLHSGSWDRCVTYRARFIDSSVDNAHTHLCSSPDVLTIGGDSLG